MGITGDENFLSCDTLYQVSNGTFAEETHLRMTAFIFT